MLAEEALVINVCLLKKSVDRQVINAWVFILLERLLWYVLFLTPWNEGRRPIPSLWHWVSVLPWGIAHLIPGIAMLQVEEGASFLLTEVAIPDAMCWRHHDSDISDPAPKDGFDEADVVTLTHQSIEDPEGKLKYLRLPFLSGLDLEAWRALTEQDFIPQHTTSPLSSDEPIPGKTDSQQRFEDSDPKWYERGSKWRKEKITDHIPCPTPLQTIEGVTSDASRGENVGLLVLELVFDDDVDERVNPLYCNPVDNGKFVAQEETPMPDPLLRGVGADGAGSSLSPSLFVPTWGIHQRSRVTTPGGHKRKSARVHAQCSEHLAVAQAEKDGLMATNAEQALRIKELEQQLKGVDEVHSAAMKNLEDQLAQKDSALVYAERVSSDRLSENEELRRLLQSHEYKQSLSVPFNYALQTGWGQGLAEARSEEELREIMMRMNGFDPYSDKKMNAEYERLFSKTYSLCGAYFTLSEEVGARSPKNFHLAAPPKDAPKAGSGGVAFAPKLVRAAEVAGSKDTASREISKSKTGPSLQDPDRASGGSKAPPSKKLSFCHLLLLISSFLQTNLGSNADSPHCISSRIIKLHLAARLPKPALSILPGLDPLHEASLLPFPTMPLALWWATEVVHLWDLESVHHHLNGSFTLLVLIVFDNFPWKPNLQHEIVPYKSDHLFTRYFDQSLAFPLSGNSHLLQLKTWSSSRWCPMVLGMSFPIEKRAWSHGWMFMCVLGCLGLGSGIWMSHTFLLPSLASACNVGSNVPCRNCFPDYCSWAMCIPKIRMWNSGLPSLLVRGSHTHQHRYQGSFLNSTPDAIRNLFGEVAKGNVAKLGLKYPPSDYPLSGIEVLFLLSLRPEIIGTGKSCRTGPFFIAFLGMNEILMSSISTGILANFPEKEPAFPEGNNSFLPHLAFCSHTGPGIVFRLGGDLMMEGILSTSSSAEKLLLPLGSIERFQDGFYIVGVLYDLSGHLGHVRVSTSEDLQLFIRSVPSYGCTVLWDFRMAFLRVFDFSSSPKCYSLLYISLALLRLSWTESPEVVIPSECGEPDHRRG
ncbi:hypothetical protein Tco_0681942 [Tanacetum coccineum]|uniref:Uncharacterized protein n=1 Tax=Tanacetum coccineum TaxID=301880 RepID=A0ABQ4XPS1_9ASTR